MRPRVLLAVSLTAALAACSSKKASNKDSPPPLAPADAAPARPVAPRDPYNLTIENRRTTPIWVASQTSCAQQAYRVEGPGGAPVRLDGQAIGCDLARKGNCPTIGACAGPGVFHLPPGATMTAVWNTHALVDKELPAGEVGAGCPSACVVSEPVADGTYQVVVEAWSACAGECACEGEPGTACARPAGLTGTPDLRKTAPVVLPGAAGTTLVFLDPPPPP